MESTVEPARLVLPTALPARLGINFNSVRVGLSTTTNGLANKCEITSNGTAGDISCRDNSCRDNIGTDYADNGTTGDNGAASYFGDIESIEISTYYSWTSFTTSGIVPSSGIVSSKRNTRFVSTKDDRSIGCWNIRSSGTGNTN